MAWRPDDPHRPSPPPDLRHVTPRVIVRDGTAWIFVPPEELPPLGTITSSTNERK